MPSSVSPLPVRRRWFVVLVFVAAIDVATVLVLLSRSQQLAQVSREVAADSQTWAEQLKKVSTLQSLSRAFVHDADPAGTASILEEKARLEGAVVAFDQWAAVVSQDLATAMTLHRAAIEADLDAASGLAHTLAEERATILELFRAGEFEQAARGMARAERSVAALNGHLNGLQSTLGSAHEELRAAHQGTAVTVRRAEVMIAGINLLLVVAGVVYARSVSSVAAETDSDAGGIFVTEPVPVFPSEKPSIPTSAPVPGVTETPGSAPAPNADDAPATLEDFPSELDQAPQRRAS